MIIKINWKNILIIAVIANIPLSVSFGIFSKINRRIGSFEQSASILNRSIVRAITQRDLLFIEEISRTVSSAGLDSLEVFTLDGPNKEKELLLSFPTSSADIPIDCKINVSHTLSLFGQELGLLRGCYSWSRIISSVVFNYHTIFLILISSLSIGFASFFPAYFYRRRMQLLANQLTIWSDHSLSANDINQNFSISGADKIEKMFVGIITDLVKKSIEISMTAQRNKAIALTTQMLAHDVRKPFSMLKMAIEMIEKSNCSDESLRVISFVKPELDRSLSQVNGLISDVMEIGSEYVPTKDPVSILELSTSTLSELFSIHRKCDILVEYSFQHSKMISGDSLKISRVFSNIILNAIQAIKLKGNIFFRSRDLEKNGIPMVEVKIGNYGSVIHEEEKKKVFDAFYTKGKRGGTGIGLAIVKKIIESHGGQVWCESGVSDSFPQGYVEFIMHLPAHDADDLNSTFLKESKHSREFTFKNASFADVLATRDAGDFGAESDLIDIAVKRSGILSRRFSVLIIDDEVLYQDTLRSQLNYPPKLSTIVSVTTLNSANNIDWVLENSFFDLIILDLDLGESEYDGFDVLSKIRACGVRSFICVHSNRILSGDSKKSIGLGADVFLPKPMGRMHLLKILLQSTVDHLGEI